MKKNFYFQHSLMSMFDPRMKHLVDNEGLRGLGAYWIIIEKLSILPEPRAQLDYLRAYCDSKKITLCYLKKIILEYDLFELEEDGYFMPKELNPLHKKGEKTEKTTQEKPDSKAKNDEKQQKVSRNKSKKQSDLSSNTLNNKYLAKNATNTNKKTIDINKTTTATTEEKEAAAAGALSSPQTTPAPIEPWHTLIDKLTEESAWLDVACMHSGYGSLLKTHIKEAVEVFRQHVILHDNGNVLLNMKDTRQYFVNFVRASAPRRSCICCCRASKSSSPPPHLPTPTATSCLWTDGAPTWAAPSPTKRHPDRTIPPSGTKRPVRGRRKPRRRHRKSRNRNPAETPHSGTRNATRQRSECHMSTFRMPHLSTSQVWHLPP